MSLFLQSDVKEESNNVDEDARNIEIPKYFRSFNDLFIQEIVSKDH